jgi:flagellar FliJ protein
VDKSFKFSLQKLLEIRKDKEEEGKRLFTKSQREMEEMKSNLDDLLSNYEKYSGINKGETLAYQKIKKNYLYALNKSIEQAEKDLEKKEKEVNYRREQLKLKQIERKTVDILKEKKYTEYINEKNRIEQLANDEFALYSYLRNNKV